MESSGKLVACLVMMMVAAAPHAEAAISCSTVVSSLSPCLNYLRSGGAPPVACCDGVKYLYNGSGDRQGVCNCLKSLAPSVGAKAEFINSIPAKCAVNIPYVYSPSLDCSKVH